MKQFFSGVLFAFLFIPVLFSQETRVIELSGVVVDQENAPLPFVNILVKNRLRGTCTDFHGEFYILVRTADTLVFSSVGYRRRRIFIPDTFSEDYINIRVALMRDTIMLPETVIKPWMNYEQFKEAFVNFAPPDDDYQRAMRNIALILEQERLHPSPMGPVGNYRYQVQQHADRLYYAGQQPPNNLLNPLAWAEFIKALKRGDFKRKDKD